MEAKQHKESCLIYICTCGNKYGIDDEPFQRDYERKKNGSRIWTETSEIEVKNLTPRTRGRKWVFPWLHLFNRKKQKKRYTRK